MKKLGGFNKVIYFFNLIAATLLLISFVLPFVPPKSFPTLSLLSLAVSPLLLLNILFAVYWLIRLKKQLWLSIIILFIGYIHFNAFVRFSSESSQEAFSNSLKLMTYNVRLFNAYETNNDEEVPNKMKDLILSESPDIVCLQEYYAIDGLYFSDYNYDYIHFKKTKNNRKVKLGHAIFSKFPIINQGAFDFPDTGNNVLFVDIVKGQDTLRIYNLHLQSLKINPTVIELKETSSQKLRKRVSTAFVMQQEQMLQVLEHLKISPYPIILAGDFNNTPFSFVYRKMKTVLNDAFLERGNGLGSTYKFDFYPMRIDYIFSDSFFETLQFKTIKESYSDHYPVTSLFGWN